MTDDDKTAAHIAALSLTVQDLAQIIHQIAPEALEAKMRASRLMLQEAQAGRVGDQDEQALMLLRLRRDLYERAVARNDDTDD